jgi:hypothetical protein
MKGQAFFLFSPSVGSKIIDSTIKAKKIPPLAKTKGGSGTKIFFK